MCANASFFDSLPKCFRAGLVVGKRLISHDCDAQRLHAAVFNPTVTLLHFDRFWFSRSFVLLNVADFKGIRVG
jgi:hypothetical protein